MKKFFALVLIVCLMMASMAMGEELVVSDVLQDEQTPAVVAEENEAGELIIAKICDASGAVLAEVKDDGSLVMTDVHQRALADKVIAERLTDAYEGVMHDVHYGDVDAIRHEEIVKIDINELLERLGHGQTAHDLVMYELFDVMAYGDAAALLVDGNYMEMTFELVVEEQSLPLVIIFTPNGTEWEIMDYTAAGDKRFTVRLTQPGTLALLCDGHEAMGIGEKSEKPGHFVPGEAAEDTDHSSNFTPSVSGKDAPEMTTSTGSEGETIVGYIRNSVTGEEIAVPDDNYIIITAVAERDYVMDIQTHEHLEWGYDGVLQAANVGELISDTEEGTIAADIEAVLAELGLELTCDQLVVKDLFEVTAYGDYLDYMYDENNHLDITFDADLDPSKPLVAIHSSDSVYWHVHPTEDVALNADGTVTLKMYDLGTVAFLVEKEEIVNAETAVQSPN